MAGPLDTGQQIATHLLFNIIPLLIYHLVYLVLPENPMLFRGNSGGILAMLVPKDSGVSRNQRRKWLAKQFKTTQASKVSRKSSPLTSCRH